MDAVGERPQITERQHDRRRLLRQSGVEQVGVTRQAPRDEAESDSCAAGLDDFRSNFDEWIEWVAADRRIGV